MRKLQTYCKTLYMTKEYNIRYVINNKYKHLMEKKNTNRRMNNDKLLEERSIRTLSIERL